jgi:L-seryl-tRNA(Ser) seleniumtransferase
MLFKSLDELKKDAISLQEKIKDICKTEVIETKTVIGGGTTPNKKIPTIALSIGFKNYKPNKIEKLLRAKNIIGRIENEQFLLDFRTIQKDEIALIENILKEMINE